MGRVINYKQQLWITFSQLEVINTQKMRKTAIFLCFPQIYTLYPQNHSIFVVCFSTNSVESLFCEKGRIAQKRSHFSLNTIR